MRLVKTKTGILSLEDLVLISQVDSHKKTSWEIFKDELDLLELSHKSYPTQEVLFPADTPDFILKIVGEHLITSIERLNLINKYKNSIKFGSNIVSAWFLLDMWTLSTNQFKNLSIMTNGDFIKKLYRQGCPVYKPGSLSWTNFWKICIIEMQASRKYYE